MNKMTILGAAALTVGLACGVLGQKKNVEFLGPPVRENEKPKPKKEKAPPQDSGKGQTPAPDGPQSGQAAGFGVGRPGGNGQPLPTAPPLQNPPDTILPPIGEPTGNKDEKKGEVVVQPAPDGMEAKTDRAVGPPAKNTDAATTAPPAKSLAPNRKAKRPRRVKKG